MFNEDIYQFTTSMRSFRGMLGWIGPACRWQEGQILRSAKSLRDLVPDMTSGFKGVRRPCISYFLRRFPLSPSPDDGRHDSPIDFTENSRGERWVVRKGEEASIGMPYPDYIEAVIAVAEPLSDILHQGHVMRTHVLISLTSSVETLLTRLLKTYYETQDTGSIVADESMSLRQLRTLGSIDAAEEYLLEMQVRNMLSGGLEEWLRQFKTKLGLSLDGYLSEHRARLVEIFQRRNLLVHHAGKVSNQYLSTVDPVFSAGLARGDAVGLPTSYLIEAIDVCELTFTLLAIELWKKVAPTDEDRGTNLAALAYGCLIAERWQLAEGFSFFAVNDKGLPEDARTIAQVNYWIALKKQARLNEVADKIAAWDVSAKKSVYTLARHALLDEVAEFFSLLPELVASKELPYYAAERWPLFSDMRDMPEYAEFQKKYAPALDVNPYEQELEEMQPDEELAQAFCEEEDLPD